MAEIIQQWQYPGKLHPKLLEDEAFEACKKAGISSLQSYVAWAEIEREPGKIDFSSYDALVEKLKKHNLKWVPFLILGPNYATPKWFQESKESVFAKCLEHQKESKIQSIWNPFLPKWVDRFLKLVAEHYRDQRIFESITLGISGNWGEAIYPAEGGFYQNFHTHEGWWCGDKYARQDFINFLLKKYHSLNTLNKIWATDFSHPSEINFPPIPPKLELKYIYPILKRVPKPIKTQLKLIRRHLLKILNEKTRNLEGKQRWLDFINWYLVSMSKWAEFWLQTARKYFPNNKIYLVTGGIGKPILGADFSTQTKIAAKYKAGIRITNQTDEYGESFIRARLISSAARFYRTYFTTEEAGINQPYTVAMRIFDTVSSGAGGFYCKSIIGTGFDLCTKQNFSPGKPTQGAAILAQNLHYLTFSKPIIKVAVLFPNTSIALNPDILTSIYNQGAQLRDLIDFDLVDENMIADGALGRYLFLVILDGNWLKKKTFEEIKDWILNGGIFITSRNLELSSISKDGSGFHPQLFSQKEGFKKLGKGYTVLSPKSNKDYLNFIAESVYNQKERYPWKGILNIDGEKDGIYATKFQDKILYYNSKNLNKKKEIKLNNIVRFIEVEENSISSVSYKPN
jgi:hypothetical protein